MNNEKICEIFKADNSLDKYRKLQQKNQIRVVGAIIAKNQQLARKELKRHLNFLEHRNSLLKKLIINQKILNLNLTFYELKPIILIQSHIRRWISQKSYEIVKCKKNEEISKKDLQEMTVEVNNKLMMGDITKQAAFLIVKNVRIHLWRKKIRRIKYVFENYYLKSTKNFLVVFTNSLLCWSSRQKLGLMLFLHNRRLKLKKIRENLAIISIKNAIKAKKFNILSGRLLYQKIRKRRKKNLFSSNTTKHPHHEFFGLTAQQTFSMLMQEIENEELSETEMNEQEKKLNLLKAAYGVRENVDKSVTPVLGRKFCVTPGKSTASQLSETQRFRNLLIGTPPLAPQKRMFFNSELPSRLMAYTNAGTWKMRPLSCSGKVSDDMNFLKPTEFYLRKTLIKENQEDQVKGKKVRPPSRRVMKNTASSMAKRRLRASSGKQKSIGLVNIEKDEKIWKSFEGSIYSVNKTQYL